MWLMLLAVTVAVCFMAALLHLLTRKLDPYPQRVVYASERMCYEPRSGEHCCVDDVLMSPPADDIQLSVVIPAYNEESRLPNMLDECFGYLETRSALAGGDFQYEIVLVDDGSTDGTTDVGHLWTRRLGINKFRVVTLVKNRGKGGAVKEGIMRCRGRHILFVDADGATRFGDLERLELAASQLQSSTPFIVCGSRAHLQAQSMAQRSLLRTILMLGFHACVWLFGCRSVRDTQCGFKLMSRSAAQNVIPSLHLNRWAFDVEMLKIAEMSPAAIALIEVPVHWTEIDGSKLSPAFAAIEMLADLVLLWLRYRLGWWRVVHPSVVTSASSI